MQRVMITGSREKYWKDPQSVKRGILSRLKTFPPDTVFMQGCADGVDAWASEACQISGHDCVPYPPDRSVPSPQRFHERNDRMLDEADFVLAFHDGESPGTASVIRKARDRRLPLWVVRNL